VPLPDALDYCPGLLPRYATPMIRVGYETGTLAHALRRAATVHNLDEPIWMALQGKVGLPAAVAGVWVFVVDVCYDEELSLHSRRYFLTLARRCRR